MNKENSIHRRYVYNAEIVSLGHYKPPVTDVNILEIVGMQSLHFEKSDTGGPGFIMVENGVTKSVHPNKDLYYLKPFNGFHKSVIDIVNLAILGYPIVEGGNVYDMYIALQCLKESIGRSNPDIDISDLVWYIVFDHENRTMEIVPNKLIGTKKGETNQ